jgi:hypothetical protein
VILDGTIIESDRCCEPVISAKGEGIDLWYSGPVRYSSDGRTSMPMHAPITLQRSLRCLGERGFALLTGRWRTLHHVTAGRASVEYDNPCDVGMSGLLGFRAMEHCNALVMLGTDWLTRC